MLVELWCDAESHLRNAPPPEVTNTDGDPIALTRDVFRLAPGARDAVVAALGRLTGAQVREDEGELLFAIVRPAPESMAMDNLVLGHARLEARRLVLESNSVRRADALRGQVESACGAALRSHKREVIEAAELLARYPADGPRARRAAANMEAPPPEAREAMRQWKREYYRRWLDESIPGLDGLTPRQAVKRPGSRRKLERLLREFEHLEGSSLPEDRLDVAGMRASLGLKT